MAADKDYAAKKEDAMRPEIPSRIVNRFICMLFWKMFLVIKHHQSIISFDQSFSFWACLYNTL